MKQIFLGIFKDEQSIIDGFQLDDDDLYNITILFAVYIYENYYGRAFVLFEIDGKLYEVNGEHCSCYGLEGQWEPEETTIEDIKYRLTEGELGYDSYDGENYFRNELIDYIGEEYKNG